MAITNFPIFSTLDETKTVSAGITDFNLNIDRLVIASTVSAGFTEISTEEEVSIGADIQRSVTPNTFNTYMRNVSSNFSNYVPVSSNTIETNQGIIKNKFITPSSLHSNICNLSANSSEVNTGIISNKFITPLTFINLEDANYAFSSVPDYTYTFNYTGAVQTFQITGSIKYLIIKCIAGGGGGFYDQTASGTGSPYFFNAEDSYLYANGVYINYANKGIYGTNNGGNGGDGTLAGTGGLNGSGGYSPGTTGTGFSSVLSYIKFSPYIQINKCSGGNGGRLWTIGNRIDLPGYGGPGGGSYGGGGGGAGSSIVFCTFENNVLFVDKSFVQFSDYDVNKNICSKIYISNQTLYMYVGKGGLGGGDGTYIQPQCNGNNGQIVIYCWNG